MPRTSLVLTSCMPLQMLAGGMGASETAAETSGSAGMLPPSSEPYAFAAPRQGKAIERTAADAAVRDAFVAATRPGIVNQLRAVRREVRAGRPGCCQALSLV